MTAEVYDIAAARGRHTGRPGVNRHAVQLQAGQMRRVVMAARPHRHRMVRGQRPLERKVRRLAWKVEHRQTGVSWRESRSIRGELAPVIPIRASSVATDGEVAA